MAINEKDELERLRAQLDKLKDDFAKLKPTFDRIIAFGGIIGAIVVAYTGFTVWQLPGKIHDAVNDKVNNDTLEQYRAAAQKASVEAQTFASDAGKSAKALDEIKTPYSQALAKLSDIEGSAVRFGTEVSLTSVIDMAALLGLKEDVKGMPRYVDAISPPDDKNIRQRWIIKLASPR